MPTNAFPPEIQLLADLHKPNARLGPGSDEHTRLALQLSGLKDRADLRIADLGCGTGASTLVLAEELDGEITAIDLFPEFLAELNRRAASRGILNITTAAASFDDLPFEPHSLDAIWSEGAIYNLGFEAGVKAWREFLAPAGILAVSELTWTTANRPSELQIHWESEYPEVDTASAKIAVLEDNGFKLEGYFPLPPSCWLDNYYRPLQARFPSFLDEQERSSASILCVEENKREIALYERFQDFFSYGFYVAKRVA